MANAVKTIIGTGTSSGLGFEVIKQLIRDQPMPHHFILGVRDPAKSKSEFDSLQYDSSKHDISLHKVDFSNLREVRTFAQEALAKLGEDKLDYVLLNHAIIKDAKGPGPHGSPWSEQYVVNHQSHHYLMHLLREPILASHSRIIFVSSGAVRMPKETDSLRSKLLADSGTGGAPAYGASKFVHLLGAHYWRRTLGDQAIVVAVSPGMIPSTRLSRHMEGGSQIGPDVKDIPTGAQSILRAFTRSDFPKDPNSIFLTSWGEWWDPNEIFPLSLDRKLQDEWCPPKEEIEREAKL